MTRRRPCFLQALRIVLFFAAFVSVSPVLADENRMALIEEVSGIEYTSRHPADPFLYLLTGSLYLPRQVLDGTLFGIGKASSALSDPDFIRTVEDLLYLYRRKLVWFPVVWYGTGFRPVYGGGLYYTDRGFAALIKGTVHDADYWSMRLKTSYRYYVGRTSITTALYALLDTKDDLRYYGLGSDPRNDPRNLFLRDEDYGIFSESRRTIQWSARWEPHNHWAIAYLGYYQRRAFKSFGRGDHDLQDVLALTAVPGFSNGLPIKEFYNELSVEIDTRDRKKMITPGVRAEGYFGVSAGVGNNRADLFRTGFDAAAFIPVIQGDRILIPRLIYDLTENVDGTRIPFSEYPQPRTFRGVSRRDRLRSEKVSAVPSLEYVWPVSHMFSGHVFVDFLAVGSGPGRLRWSDGVWAGGIGLDFHYFEKELGRAQFAYGTEGFQFTFTVGRAVQTNARSDR